MFCLLAEINILLLLLVHRHSSTDGSSA